MKKISRLRKRYLLRRDRKKQRKRQKLLRRLKCSMRLVSVSHFFSPKRDRFLIIPGPTILGFQSEKSANNLLKWIKYLNRITIENDQPVKIDFRKSKNAESMGFLRMLAEIDRITTIKGKGFVKIWLPKDNTALQVFQQTGLNDILGIRKKIEINKENVKFWHHIEGTVVDGEKAGTLIEKLILETDLDGESAKALYEGAVEAITNTVMHAYNDHTKRENKWWMFAGHFNDNLIVTICDLGAGIPATIKSKPTSFREKFIDVFSSFFTAESNDSQLIELAMQIGRSKTGYAHRGLGMAELLKFIDSAKDGKLIIVSGKGRYRYIAANGKSQLDSHKESIEATVVGWKVPLKSVSKRDKLQ